MKDVITQQLVDAKVANPVIGRLTRNRNRLSTIVNSTSVKTILNGDGDVFVLMDA